jgi:hypothetical protein
MASVVSPVGKPACMLGRLPAVKAVKKWRGSVAAVTSAIAADASRQLSVLQPVHRGHHGPRHVQRQHHPLAGGLHRPEGQVEGRVERVHHPGHRLPRSLPAHPAPAA